MIPSCVPKDAFCQELYNYAKSHLDPIILDHSLRVFIYASAFSKANLSAISQFQPTAGSEIFLSATELAEVDNSLVFAASMFHDMGASATHDHDQRFEVCGADAAVAYMQSHGMTNVADQRKVWEAITLHTSPGIAERMGLLTRVLRMGPKTDFGHEPYRRLLEDGLLKATEAMLPRGEIEKVLGDSVAGQAERRKVEERDMKAPAVSWPWNLLRCRLEEPEWKGVNKGF